MHKRNGFTAVELTIAMVIMAILLAIGIVTFRGSLISSRDREREADVRAIAEHMESLYPQVLLSGSTTIKKAGSYPYTTAVSNATYSRITLDGLPTSAKNAPGMSSGLAFTISTSPSPTINQYYYVPLRSTGAICSLMSQECRTFRIYYRLEATNQIKYVESRRK